MRGQSRRIRWEMTGRDDEVEALAGGNFTAALPVK